MMSVRQQKIIICLFFIGIISFLGYLLASYIPVKNDDFSNTLKAIFVLIGISCWIIFCIMGLIYQIKKNFNKHSEYESPEE